MGKKESVLGIMKGTEIVLGCRFIEKLGKAWNLSMESRGKLWRAVEKRGKALKCVRKGVERRKKAWK